MKQSVNKSVSKIPKLIWQTLKQTPLTEKHVTIGLKKRNIGWQYALYNDNELEYFMDEKCAKHWPDYVKAYHMLNPVVGAAKADMFRYCILWMYGGVYVDYDSDCKQPLMNGYCQTMLQ